jgi:hypothetical protein
MTWSRNSRFSRSSWNFSAGAARRQAALGPVAKCGILCPLDLRYVGAEISLH